MRHFKPWIAAFFISVLHAVQTHAGDIEIKFGIMKADDRG